MTMTQQANGRSSALDLERLNSGALQKTQYSRNWWEAVVPHGTTKESVLGEGYFRMHAERIRPGDRIDIRDPGCTFYGQLVCQASDMTSGAVIVREIAWDEYEHSTMNDFLQGAFLVSHDPVSNSWTVAMRSTGEVVKSGFRSSDSARSFASQNERNIGEAARTKASIKDAKAVNKKAASKGFPG